MIKLLVVCIQLLSFLQLYGQQPDPTSQPSDFDSFGSSDTEKPLLSADYTRPGFFIYVDQDLFYPSKNQDRNYTMGASLGVSGKIAKTVSPLQWFKFKNYNGDINSVSLGYGAFTPLDIGSYEPVTDDRPYGGILALSFNRTFFKKIDESIPNAYSNHAFYGSFIVGVIGTNVGKAFQTWVHEKRLAAGVSTRVVPQGWHNQISNGGEPTAMITVGHKKLFTVSESSKVNQTWKVFGLSELNLGYYTNATVGITTTIGHLRDWFNFNIGPTSYVSQRVSQTDGPKFFAFASARAQYVIYNALLQGQFKNNPYELTAKQVSDFVFITDFGGNVSFPFGLNTRLQFTRRSPEYTINLEEGRGHYWGSIYLSYTIK